MTEPGRWFAVLARTPHQSLVDVAVYLGQVSTADDAVHAVEVVVVVLVVDQIYLRRRVCYIYEAGLRVPKSRLETESQVVNFKLTLS